MRQIKFRAWLPGIKKMTYSHTLEEIMHWNTKIENNGTAIWLQFTGQRDIQRTAKEIYEGDLLQSQIGDRHIWRVLFEDGSFILEQVNGLKRRGKKKHAQDFCCEDDIYLYQLMVVGNVHENPELLGRSHKCRNCYFLPTDPKDKCCWDLDASREMRDAENNCMYWRGKT